MAEKSLDFGFLATGIGSVPFLEMEETCREIARLFPHMPFWPQFVKRSYLEDMSVQYSEGLPLIEVNQEERISQAATFEQDLLAVKAEFIQIIRNPVQAFIRHAVEQVDFLEKSNFLGSVNHEFILA